MDYDDIIENLKAVKIVDGESSHELLSSIAGAVYHQEYGWTRVVCEFLRQKLIAMATDAKAYADAKADAEAYVERLHEAVSNHQDITVDGVDYMPCPTDSNGETIDVGDKLDGYGKTIEVVELRIGRIGWVIVSSDGNTYANTWAFTHHRKITVEDVLKEMLDAVADGSLGYDDAAPKYAKLLQIKEVDDD